MPLVQSTQRSGSNPHLQSFAGSLTLAIFPPRRSGLGSARTPLCLFFPSKLLITAISVYFKVYYDHLPHNCRSECKSGRAPGAGV